jgi:tetratricopeptide (TPR) repeat protein
LDPLTLQINTNLSLIYYLTRQYDLAVDQARKTLELDPNYARARFRLGKALVQKSQFEEAISEFKKAISISEDSPYVGCLGHAYAVSGNKEAALKIVEQLQESSKKKYISPYSIAIIYAGLGDKELTFRWLEEAVDGHDDFLDQLLTDPVWDPYRSDPRYQDILRRMGLLK